VLGLPMDLTGRCARAGLVLPFSLIGFAILASSLAGLEPERVLTAIARRAFALAIVSATEASELPSCCPFSFKQARRSLPAASRLGLDRDPVLIFLLPSSCDSIPHGELSHDRRLSALLDREHSPGKDSMKAKAIPATR